MQQEVSDWFQNFGRLAFRTSMAKKKNPNAVALGRLGGSKGGKIRASKLTPEKRREIARQAVLARWAKAKGKTHPKNTEDKG
jgi:hypothetical protein